MGFHLALIGAILLCGPLASCERAEPPPTPLLLLFSTPYNWQLHVAQDSVITLEFNCTVDKWTVIHQKSIVFMNAAQREQPAAFWFQGSKVIIMRGSPLKPDSSYLVAVRPNCRSLDGQGPPHPFVVMFSTAMTSSSPCGPRGPISGGS